MLARLALTLRWLLFLLFFALGLWMVAVNATPVRLNLVFWVIPGINAGLALVLAFAAGSLMGILVGLNIYTRTRLRTQLWWLKREVERLRQQNLSGSK